MCLFLHVKSSKSSAFIRNTLVFVCLSFIGVNELYAAADSRRLSQNADMTFNFDLPARPLTKTLIELGAQANITVVAPYDVVSPYQSSPLVGTYTLGQALSKVLWRTDLSYRIEREHAAITVVIQRKTVPVSPPSQAVARLEPVNRIEEVVVTGMRASMAKSLDIKYFANGIVDAITAEDVGKFPDTNLAESMQRISGVAISRSNGEGSKVTVRGFGEDYNLVTLNGRTIPAASAPVKAVADTRGFDFSNLASEGISAVEVSKTSHAHKASGAIGATIDIQTVKPFDFSEPLRFLGVKAVSDSTDRSSGVTPELSTLLSWADQDSWGVSLFASLQKRDSGGSQASVDEWKTASWKPIGEADSLATHNDVCDSVGGSPLTDQCYTIVNQPSPGDLYSLPSQLHYTLADTSRSRINTQLTLQFKTQDWITSTLDYSYAENDISGTASNQSIRFTDNRSFLSFDDESVKTPVIYKETIFNSEGEATGKGITFEQQAFDSHNKQSSLGLNILFEPNEFLTLRVDAHDSSAVSGPGKSDFGRLATLSVGANVVGSQTVDWRGDLPILSVDINDQPLEVYGSADGVFDASDIGTQVAYAYYSQQKTDVTQLRLDAELELDVAHFDFGLDIKNLKSRMLFSEIYYTLGDWGITDPDVVPDDFFIPKNFAEEFSDYNTTGSFRGGFVADIDRLANWAVGDRYTQAFNGGYRYSRDWAVDRLIEEYTQAFYAQAVFELSVAGMPGRVVAGLRHEKTDLDSVTNVYTPEEIVWLDNNDFSTEYGANKDALAQVNSYSHVLPNLDLSLDASDALKLRASFSKSIARPTYGQLSSAVSGFDVFGITTEGLVTATTQAGNPKLKPLQSSNIDLSIELYVSDSSFASMGYYRKQIDNFVGIQPLVLEHFDLKDSSAGPRAQAARAVLSAAPDFDGTITPKDLFNQIAAAQYEDVNTNGDDSYYGDAYDIHSQDNDPAYQVTTYTPVNNKKAAISGFELNAQHFFGESGLGVLFNYTMVNGDVAYDVSAAPSATQFALIGLSDTLNVVAMYEKHGFQGRIAYNWRDEFLAALAEEPRFTEAYAQIDLILSYALSDALSLSLEGLNISGENSRQHGRSTAQLLQLEQLGARYMLGAQYRF